MAITLDQPVYYVVRFKTRFKSLADVQREAPEQLAAHMHRSQQLHPGMEQHVCLKWRCWPLAGIDRH